MLMPSSNHLAKNFFDTHASHYVQELKEIEHSIGLREFITPDSDYYRLKNATDRICDLCLEVEENIGHDKELLKSSQARFRNMIAPWYHKSPLFFHGITKPRGYAGDYQMLMAIYEAKVRSSGIGGYLDYYFLNTQLARAVVARMESIQEYLENAIRRGTSDLSILDVACGPCQEYVQGVALPEGRNIQVSLLDYDRGALEHVEKNVIGPRIDREKFHTIRYNALRMRSAERFVKQHGKYDILYSVGLCDYIADKQLIPMLRGWRNSVRDGGVVIVAFKDSRSYSTPIYQWVTDWYFLQRTQEDCTRIMKEAGFDVERMRISHDKTGIIMNFIAPVSVSSKMGSTLDAQHIRLDPAHPNEIPTNRLPPITNSEEPSSLDSTS